VRGILIEDPLWVFFFVRFALMGPVSFVPPDVDPLEDIEGVRLDELEDDDEPVLRALDQGNCLSGISISAETGPLFGYDTRRESAENPSLALA